MYTIPIHPCLQPYTEWVFWSKNKPMSADDLARCPDHHVLPNGDEICFVEDKVRAKPFVVRAQLDFCVENQGVLCAVCSITDQWPVHWGHGVRFFC